MLRRLIDKRASCVTFSERKRRYERLSTPGHTDRGRDHHGYTHPMPGSSLRSTGGDLMSGKSKVQAGDRYARWTLVRRDYVPGQDYVRWIVECDCGTKSSIQFCSLTSGRSKSCGCYRADYMKERSTTHGLSGIPEFRIWQQIIQRCERETNPAYPRYGGRGISVCDRWKDFPTFLADMGRRPSDDLTIERNNNHGNYEPGNCRWATMREQSRNTRRNIRVMLDGAEMVLKDAAMALGVKYTALLYRCGKNNLTYQQTVDLYIGERSHG